MMAETAVVVSKPPVIEIDLTKASPRVLRHLKKERDKDRVIDMVKTVLNNPMTPFFASILFAGALRETDPPKITGLNATFIAAAGAVIGIAMAGGLDNVGDIIKGIGEIVPG